MNKFFDDVTNIAKEFAQNNNATISSDNKNEVLLRTATAFGRRTIQMHLLDKFENTRLEIIFLDRFGMEINKISFHVYNNKFDKVEILESLSEVFL